jgi:uncharacterized protein YbjT (DUF2867 family)
MDNELIVLAGATGNLGGRIARAIFKRGANVKAVVRRNSNPDKIEVLRKQGAAIAEVDFNNVPEVTEACLNGSCVISALSGLREVIVDTQTLLLDAAVKAGVPRFIPSDYAIDFTKLPPGTNRNLDLRREFHEHLDKAPIAATSILMGTPINCWTLRPWTMPLNSSQPRLSTLQLQDSCVSLGIKSAPEGWRKPPVQ